MFLQTTKKLEAWRMYNTFSFQLFFFGSRRKRAGRGPTGLSSPQAKASPKGEVFVFCARQRGGLCVRYNIER